MLGFISYHVLCYELQEDEIQRNMYFARIYQVKLSYLVSCHLAATIWSHNLSLCMVYFSLFNCSFNLHNTVGCNCTGVTAYGKAIIPVHTRVVPLISSVTQKIISPDWLCYKS